MSPAQIPSVAALSIRSPETPWDVTPGSYTRDDGTTINIEGRDQFWSSKRPDPPAAGGPDSKTTSLEVHTGKTEAGDKAEKDKQGADKNAQEKTDK